MKLESYKIVKSTGSNTLYQFESVGVKGTITKAVLFTGMNLHHFYNIGFGDLSADGAHVDDLHVSDNGDMHKVLTTVAQIVIDFSERNPEARIFAVGSTPSRTRLYRMGITGNLEEIEALFDIYGFRNNAWENFVPAMDYEAYYVERKR